MKKYPIPDKQITKRDELREHIEELFFNAMAYLKIDSYSFTVVFEGEENFVEHKNAGFSITVDFPYRKFHVSVQKDTVDKAFSKTLSTPGFWQNIEHGVFHECFHILGWRLSELARRRYTTPTDIEDADEELADHLANVFVHRIRQIRNHEK